MLNLKTERWFITLMVIVATGSLAWEIFFPPTGIFHGLRIYLIALGSIMLVASVVLWRYNAREIERFRELHRPLRDRQSGG